MSTQLSVSGNLLVQVDAITQLFVDSIVRPDAAELLRQSEYGSGGLRYRQTTQAVGLERLHDPLLFYLYEADVLIGFYALEPQLLQFSTRQLTCYYGRYLTVRADRQSRGLGQLLKSTAVTYVQKHAQLPYLLYSLVESKNTRSLAASFRQGFSSVAELGTYLFGRFTPKQHSSFRVAIVEELPAIASLLEQQYAHYGFRHWTRIGYQQYYFVLEVHGRIVAGVQANPTTWQFTRLPGRLGPIIQRVISHIAGLNRFINPDQQRLVALEGVYLTDGQAHWLPVLLESVLAHFDSHLILWQVDIHDPLRQWLTRSRMGLLSGFIPGLRTQVLVKPVGLSDELSVSAPVYVSSFNYT